MSEGKVLPRSKSLKMLAGLMGKKEVGSNALVVKCQTPGSFGVCEVPFCGGGGCFVEGCVVETGACVVGFSVRGEGESVCVYLLLSNEFVLSNVHVKVVEFASGFGLPGFDLRFQIVVLDVSLWCGALFNGCC